MYNDNTKSIRTLGSIECSVINERVRLNEVYTEGNRYIIGDNSWDSISAFSHDKSLFL